MSIKCGHCNQTIQMEHHHVIEINPPFVSEKQLQAFHGDCYVDRALGKTAKQTNDERKSWKKDVRARAQVKSG